MGCEVSRYKRGADRRSIDTLRVHRLSAANRDFAGNADRYLLSLHDGHPNPLMQGLLADYVAQGILGR